MLIEVLGKEFDGVLGCDYFSAYRRYHARVRRGAPVLPGPPDPRCEVPDDAAGREGSGLWTRLREALRALFGVIHRREELSAEQFQSQLEAARAEVLRCGTHDVPATRHCRNLAKRFEKHGESYFRFITTPGWSRRTIWPSRRSGSW